MKRIRSNRDRISDLPLDLIERILVLLPLKDIGRTCVLPRKWRHVWTRVPHLVFDSDFGQVDRQLMNTMAILEVLLTHEGPISKFCLDIPGLRPSPQIDRVVLHLSKKSIEDLTLRCVGYKLHSCFFARFSELIQLDLFCLEFRVPSSFGRFGRLKNLKLAVAELAADFLENFLPKCPVLESLSLTYDKGCQNAAVFGPCLKAFSLCGNFKSTEFKYAPLLSAVGFDARLGNRKLVQEKASNMIQALKSLPSLQMLNFRSDILKVFAAGSIAGRLPSTSLDCVCHHSHRRICPTILHPQDGLGDDPDALFEALEELTLIGTNGSRAELDLMDFVLAKAPNLRKLYLEPSRWKTATYVSKKISKLRCPSGQSKIRIMGLE